MSIGLESVIQVSGIAGTGRPGLEARGADASRLKGTLPGVCRVPEKDSGGHAGAFVSMTGAPGAAWERAGCAASRPGASGRHRATLRPAR